MATLQEKLEAAKDLYGYDHVFVSPEGVAKFAKVFGVKLTPYRERANPEAIKGLTLNDGAKSAEGMCAASMACSICDQLGLDYMEKFGRGSQLREAVGALEAHFKAEIEKAK